MNRTAGIGPLLVAALLGVSAASAAPTEPVGSEFRVNSYTTGYQDRSSVAVAPDGSFVVVWASRDQYGSTRDVFARRFDSEGVALGSDFQINTYITGNQRSADVAMDANGDTVVVWSSDGQDGSNWGVFGQRFDSAGVSIGEEFQINTYTPGNQDLANVASAPNGDFVVVWYSRDGVYSYGIFGQRFDAAGSTVGDEFQINTYTTGSQRFPDVATDDAGNFVVVWHNRKTGGLFTTYDVLGQRFDNSGVPVGGEFLVNTYTKAGPLPRVASAADGGFLVVWAVGFSYPQHLDVHARQYDSTGSPLGDEFKVNSYTSSYQDRPAAAGDGAGNFIVAWTSKGQDGSIEGVFGQRFDPVGARLGGEFQVNTYTTGSQTYPAVAAESSGDFLVTWDNLGGVPRRNDVQGQRYTVGGLQLTVDGSCPGVSDVTLRGAPPRSEVAVVSAANTNGWIKGGTLCPGTRFEIGEPFNLPPTFVVIDESGGGSTTLNLALEHCYVQAIAFETCEMSNTVVVP